MTTGVAATPPILQFTLNNGQLAAGGSILTQVGGVNAATYQDIGLTTPLPNPIPLNSRGEISNASGASCQLFLTPNVVYTFTLYDASGNQIWPATYVNGVQVNITQAIVGAALWPQTAAETAVGVTPVNYAYPPGNLNRYGNNSTPGTTPMTTAVQAAVNQHAAGGPAVYAPAGTYLVNTINLPGSQYGFNFQGDGYLTVFQAATPNQIVFQKAATSGAIDAGNIGNFSIKANASGSTTPAFSCTGFRTTKFTNIRGQSNGSGGFYSLFSLSAYPYLCYGNEFDSCGLSGGTGWTKVWDFNNGGTTNSANNANVTRIVNPWVYVNTGLTVGIDALRSTLTSIEGGDFEDNTSAIAIISGSSTHIEDVWIEGNANSIAYQTAADGVSNTGFVENCYIDSPETISLAGCSDNIWFNVNATGGITWTNNNGTNIRFSPPAADVPTTPIVNPTAGETTGTWTLVDATQLSQTNLANEISYLLVYAWSPGADGGYTQFTITPPSPWFITKLSIGMTTQSNGVPVAVGLSGLTVNNQFSVSNVATTAYTVCIAVSIQHA